MKNTEILEDLCILGDIRERLGAKDENDTSFDDKINKMDANRIAAEYSAWSIGDSAWWYSLKNIFDELSKNK